jgi:hypothetical protein
LEDFEQRLIDLEQEKTLSEIEGGEISRSHTEERTASYTKPEEIRCSFCGKEREDVVKMVSGPDVHICNECVEICNEIVSDSLMPENT